MHIQRISENFTILTLRHIAKNWNSFIIIIIFRIEILSIAIYYLNKHIKLSEKENKYEIYGHELDTKLGILCKNKKIRAAH